MWPSIWAWHLSYSIESYWSFSHSQSSSSSVPPSSAGSSLTSTNFLWSLMTSMELNHPKSPVWSTLGSNQSLFLITSIWILPPALLTRAVLSQSWLHTSSLLLKRFSPGNVTGNKSKSASERCYSPITDSGSSRGCPIGAPLTIDP